MISKLMYIYSKFYIFSSLLFILLTLQMTGCKEKSLMSAWKDRDIVIDGNYADWENVLVYNEEQNMSFGFLNDEKFLYACLVTNDQNIKRQVRQHGLMLWFDPSGDDNKNFGIRYPIGMQKRGMNFHDRRMGGQRNKPDIDQEKLKRMFENGLNELEVFTSEDESSRMSLKEAVGIEIKTNISMEILAYEIKIPLNKDQNLPFAIGLGEQKIVGISLETPEIDMDKIRKEMREMGRRPEGGMRLGDGMDRRDDGSMRRGGRGRGDRMGPEMPSLVKIQTKIQLATRNE